MFNSKLEAMSFVLVSLIQMQKNDPKNKKIYNCIESIKKSFENHEQNMELVCQYLTQTLPMTSVSAGKRINDLITKLRNSKYERTLQEKFENPLARRAESELFAHLLISPTAKMMQSVGLISKEILTSINRLEIEHPAAIDKFLMELMESSNDIACGAFKNKPAIQDLKTILENNNANQLAEIMHIHYKFAAMLSRIIPAYPPKRPPVGKLAEIAKNYPSERGGFFKEIRYDDYKGTAARTYISGPLMYESELYTYSKGRGRNGEIKFTPSNKLSLMLGSQHEYESDLPTRENNNWVPDCKGQDPNFSSPYVLEAINNDTLYVAGPSGMTSLLLSQMEFMANFETIDLKQNYLNAVVAYIVGAGFHNIHEVIGPAQYALDLVPGYHVFVPGKPKSTEEQKLPSAPQYNIYFQQLCSIDPEFAGKRDAAWQRYLNFFQNVCVPKYFQAMKNNLIGKYKAQIELRENDPREYYKGIASRLFNACSKTEKINALQQALDVLEDKAEINSLIPHLKALNQGETKLLFNELKEYFKSIENFKKTKQDQPSLKV